MPREIHLALMRKTSACITPLRRTILFDVTALVNTLVIVDNYLRGLHITLARQQYVGTRIFEHRHKVRQDEALCKEILYGLPQS